MAGRPKIWINADAETLAYIKDSLELVQEKCDENSAEGRDSFYWKQRKTLELQEAKLQALSLAVAGGKSYEEIAKAEGVDHAKSTVQRWIQRFRQNGANCDVVDELLLVYRYRASPLRDPEILIELLRAWRTGEIDGPTSTAAWLNSKFGSRMKRPITSKGAQYWLERMPDRSGLGDANDNELEEALKERGGLDFRIWGATDSA
jgi:hypothetical protein